MAAPFLVLIHEAGHVTINSVLGVRTTNVLIDQITRGGKLYWIAYTDAPKLAFVDTPASPVGFDEILARSRITYAGQIRRLMTRMIGAGLCRSISSNFSLSRKATKRIAPRSPTLSAFSTSAGRAGRSRRPTWPA